MVYPIEMRLSAAEQLLKYNRLFREVKIDWDLANESLAVIISAHTTPAQKRAGRIVLNHFFGISEVNEMIQDVAVVIDRNDPLVKRWTKAVISRDKACVECGSESDLHAHHISHWADDPINRINVNNGVALCKYCHSKMHPEHENLILRNGGV